MINQYIFGDGTKIYTIYELFYTLENNEYLSTDWWPVAGQSAE